MSQLCKECGCDAEGLVSSLDEMDTLLGEAQAEIERLRSDAERWRENLPLIVDIAEDLEGYIDQQWQSRDQYQDQRRKYDRDMESVRKLKEAIDAAREGE